jgi:hypothetical protein
MARVTVYMTIADEDLAEGWGDLAGEFEASVKATLHEIVGDDGGAYVPHVLGVDVEDD